MDASSSTQPPVTHRRDSTAAMLAATGEYRKRYDDFLNLSGAPDTTNDFPVPDALFTDLSNISPYGAFKRVIKWWDASAAHANKDLAALSAAEREQHNKRADLIGAVRKCWMTRQVQDSGRMQEILDGIVPSKNIKDGRVRKGAPLRTYFESLQVKHLARMQSGSYVSDPSQVAQELLDARARLQAGSQEEVETFDTVILTCLSEQGLVSPTFEAFILEAAQTSPATLTAAVLEPLAAHGSPYGLLLRLNWKDLDESVITEEHHPHLSRAISVLQESERTQSHRTILNSILGSIGYGLSQKSLSDRQDEARVSIDALAHLAEIIKKTDTDYTRLEKVGIEVIERLIPRLFNLFHNDPVALAAILQEGHSALANSEYKAFIDEFDVRLFQQTDQTDWASVPLQLPALAGFAPAGSADKRFLPMLLQTEASRNALIDSTIVVHGQKWASSVVMNPKDGTLNTSFGIIHGELDAIDSEEGQRDALLADYTEVVVQKRKWNKPGSWVKPKIPLQQHLRDFLTLFVPGFDELVLGSVSTVVSSSGSDAAEELDRYAPEPFPPRLRQFFQDLRARHAFESDQALNRLFEIAIEPVLRNPHANGCEEPMILEMNPALRNLLADILRAHVTGEAFSPEGAGSDSSNMIDAINGILDENRDSAKNNNAIISRWVTPPGAAADSLPDDGTGIGEPDKLPSKEDIKGKGRLRSRSQSTSVSMPMTPTARHGSGLSRTSAAHSSDASASQASQA